MESTILNLAIALLEGQNGVVREISGALQPQDLRQLPALQQRLRKIVERIASEHALEELHKILQQALRTPLPEVEAASFLNGLTAIESLIEKRVEELNRELGRRPAAAAGE